MKDGVGVVGVVLIGGIVGMFLCAFTGYLFGRIDGRLYEQRERLTERGCEQIAREPELWECEGGERVEVKP